MDAVSIPNFALPATPGLGAIATGPQGPAVGTASNGDATVAVPSFAQIVREALGKTAAPGTAQPAFTSKAATGPGSANQKSESAGAAAIAKSYIADQGLSNLLGAAFGAVQSMATAANTVEPLESKSQNSAASAESSGPTCVANSRVATPSASGLSSLIGFPRAGAQTEAMPSNAPVSSDSQLPNGAAGSTETISSAVWSADQAAQPMSTTAEPGPSSSLLSIPSSLSQSPRAPDAAPALQIENLATTGKGFIIGDPTQELAKGASAPAVQPKPSPVNTVPSAKPGEANDVGVPITAVLRQISELQPSAKSIANLWIAHSPSAVQTTLTESATKVALGAAPFFAAHFTQLAPMVSGAQHGPAASAKLSQDQAVADAPTSVHPTSQDKSSNHGGQGQGSSSGSQDNASEANSAAVQQGIPNFASAQPAANAVKTDAPASTVAPTPPIPVAGAPADHSTPNAKAPTDAALANSSTLLPQSPEAATSRFVSNAQISQASDHSEMRIAVQTDKLGAVELHARVAGDEVGAAITVEKRDAHAALAVELPALQQALSEKQLRVEQLSLLQGAPHSTAGDAGAQSQAQQGDRGAHRSQSATPFLQTDASMPAFTPGMMDTAGIFDSQGRLSVRA